MIDRYRKDEVPIDRHVGHGGLTHFGPERYGEQGEPCTCKCACFGHAQHELCCVRIREDEAKVLGEEQPDRCHTSGPQHATGGIGPSITKLLCCPQNPIT